MHFATTAESIIAQIFGAGFLPLWCELLLRLKVPVPALWLLLFRHSDEWERWWLRLKRRTRSGC